MLKLDINFCCFIQGKSLPTTKLFNINNTKFLILKMTVDVFQNV